LSLTAKAMAARIIEIDPSMIRSEEVQAIAEALRKEEVIIYPTDTFYGLGAECHSRRALSRIYEIKERSPSKALPVLISDAAMVGALAAKVPSSFELLAAAFWPGPLTLIFRAAAHLLPELVGPERTIGVRLPAPAWIRELVRVSGAPVVATSANISGEREIDTAAEVISQFHDRVDLIVDGGKTTGGRPSTVVDLTSGIPIIRREGAIPREKLERYFHRG
jgi:L-threonylcarbamoyladenylate synthase